MDIQLPCIVAIQVGLVALYKSFGVEPSAVLGHSSGEMVAGWAVGVADMDALCKVAYARAKGQHQVLTLNSPFYNYFARPLSQSP